MTNSTYRTMLHRHHSQHGATFLANDRVIVNHYQATIEEEKEHLTKLALVDLTPLPRIGFKGADTPQWLEEQTITLPEKPNQAIRLLDQTMIARLSNNEFLLLSDIEQKANTVNTLCQWQLQENKLCYLLLRQHSHCWFMLTGKHSINMMAKICGVDLSDAGFANHQVAQTSLARINSIVIKDTINHTTAFHILSDSTSAEYLWGCLNDAMVEFSGKNIGVGAFI